MSLRDEAVAAKNLGNTYFVKKDFEGAVREFTKAIDIDPTDHVFYSNRSACYCSLGKYENALEDANRCIGLAPGFAKGFSRKGLALYYMQRYQEAIEAYEAGLKIESDNKSLQDDLATAKKALDNANNPLGKMFGPDMYVKIAMNPKLNGYMSDPAFAAKVRMLQQNPQALMTMFDDPRIQELFGVLSGIDLTNMGGMGEEGAGSNSPYGSGEAMDVETKQGEQPEFSKPDVTEVKEDEVEDVDPEEAERLKRVKEAEAEKELGNKAYKRQDFEEALRHYHQACELDATNPVYLGNIAAVLMSQKNYEECIKFCDQAIDLALYNPCDLKVLHKIYARKGNAYLKLDDMEAAIHSFDRALVQSYDKDVEKKLRQLRDIKKKRDYESYINPEIAAQHKAQGNQLFQEGKFVESIAEFTEAIRRHPTDAKLYSNRAASYVKLMEWGKALDDADKAIELDPHFSKAYWRKAKVQHFLKQYHKAIETFKKGLELCPEAEELKTGLRETQVAVQMSNYSEEADPDLQRRAMEDPDVQRILRDPSMQAVLQGMQNDPQSAMKAMQDPVVRANIETLVNAGVIQMR